MMLDHLEAGDDIEGAAERIAVLPHEFIEPAGENIGKMTHLAGGMRRTTILLDPGDTESVRPWRIQGRSRTRFFAVTA